MNDELHRVAEKAARQSYGKLISILSARCGNISAAEDSLADAFVSALRHWPEKGILSYPEAWLIATARKSLKNLKRGQSVHSKLSLEVTRRYEELNSLDTNSFLDERLKLLFVCAHPAIDPSIRAPLMLQTVLGLDASKLASAFLLSPATMGQRLVRAKAKIRDARIAFEIPGKDTLSRRLIDVLDAIYAAFGTGWEAISATEACLNDLAEEAVFLGRLLVQLLPEEAEAKALLALMLYCQARQPARLGNEGQFVSLLKQDPNVWDRAMIVEAEQLLLAASKKAVLGRYQCEAAIRSVHVQTTMTGRTNFRALHTLCALLASLSPTVGVLTAQASVWLEDGDPPTGLDRLERIDSTRKFD